MDSFLYTIDDTEMVQILQKMVSVFLRTYLFSSGSTSVCVGAMMDLNCLMGSRITWEPVGVDLN